MKILHILFLAIVTLFTSIAYAAPTVAQVEDLIAKGDYPKAREQLAEVLKVNPDSYIANRYMFEIVKIENARDNVSSAQYKLYEDRIAKIEKAKADRLAAVKKAEEEKRSAERWTIFRNIMLTIFISIGFGIVGYLGYGRHTRLKQIVAEQKRKEKWTDTVTADMLDIGNLLDSALIRTTYNSRMMGALSDLKADNLDAMNQVQLGDVNESAINQHIRNAKQYLRERCGEDI